MSDLLAIPARMAIEESVMLSLLDAINLSHSRELESIATETWLLAAAHRTDAPCGGGRAYEDDRWACVFAGDLIGHEAVPFRQILAALDTSHRDGLASLRGIFAVVAYDKLGKRLYAISDRRSQKPLFYRIGSGQVQIASNLAVFVRLLTNPEFDRTWLWQSLYFNFPVDGTTFLKGVKRLPPASVLTFDERTADISITAYANPFRARRPLLMGRQGLQRARDVFSETVPAYFQRGQRIAAALTGGWDGRTMLALAPDRNAVTAYTYGCEGCNDIIGAKRTAKVAGVDHITIPFDESFVNNLPQRAVEAVYLSGGLQGVLRSTLIHAYSTLTEGGRKFPVVISGISLGTQLRGHANVPNMISPDLSRLFRAQSTTSVPQHWRDILGSDYGEFADFVSVNLAMLERAYGAFDSTEHHLSYALYKISPAYFAGELALADHYTTVRVPAWDCDVVELAYLIEQSMLSYSQFLSTHKRGCREEMILQAYLLRQFAPDIYRANVGNNRPSSVLAGEIPHRLGHIYQGISRRVRNRSVSRNEPIEDWSVWLFDENVDFVHGLLLSTQTRVRDHVEIAFIEHTISSRNLYHLGKLLTAEIILRLIDNRWQRMA